MKTNRIVIVLLCAALGDARVASADTIDTEIGAGIGTAVDDVFGPGSGVAIRTSIASVTYAEPRLVQGKGVVYLETSGSVRGTGWGGRKDPLDGPGPSFSAHAHYAYEVPFVLRWPRNFDGSLVYYQHGYPALGLSALADAHLGEDNEARRFDEVESRYVSDGAVAMHRRHALFAPNLGGLRRDGGFSVIGLEGPFKDQPLNASLDVPITRDLAQLARRLASRLAGRAVDKVFGVGHSGGALILQFIAGGASNPLDGSPTLVLTGGNFVIPYVPASGLVFDGMIPIGGGAPPIHPQLRAPAPMILLAGNADFAGVDSVIYANRLLRAGVNLDQAVRIYQFGSLPHNFAELVESTPNGNRLAVELGLPPRHADSDRMAPVVAAAIDNLRRWAVDGVAPPQSRINGTALDTDGDGIIDAIEFALAAGGATRLFPFAEDPTIDRILFEQFEFTAAAGFPGNTRRYAEVITALEPAPGSILLPYIRCRVGGFNLRSDAELIPFPDLAARWASFDAYRSCLSEAMNTLAADRLYDKQIGQRSIVTDTVRSLFAH